MTSIVFKAGNLAVEEQEIITNGFVGYSAELAAPPYEKTRLNWIVYSSSEDIIGAMTADILWDWIYVDELWVDPDYRRQGIGKDLILVIEDYARKDRLTGLWLWTQSWQAEGFYRDLGYEEFARFPDFPEGHYRIGFRKQLQIRSCETE
jgi:GNAT superfamily N-acetyltransferase